MMTGSRKDGRHEGLLHLGHLGTIILKEGLVPDGPHAVKVIIAPKPAVLIIVLTTIISLETRAARKSLETHRAALRTMEESGLVTLA